MYINLQERRYLLMRKLKLKKGNELMSSRSKEFTRLVIALKEKGLTLDEIVEILKRCQTSKA